MKLTFLGTGAGETYPGYWCECPHCTYARKHRGKNLRTNSSMVIDEELLIDMGPSCFDNAARFGVNLSTLTISTTCNYGNKRINKASEFIKAQDTSGHTSS